MKWIFLVTVAAGSSFSLAQTIDEPSGRPSPPAAATGDGEPKALTPTEQLKALVAEYEAARQAFLKEYEPAHEAYLKSANDGASRKMLQDQLNKAREAINQQAEKCAAGCLELAEKHPNDPAALDALLWVVCNTQVNEFPENARLSRAHKQAVNLLQRDHLGSEKLGPVFRWLLRMGDVEGQKLLEEALVKSPHRAVQAQALLALANHKLSSASTVRELQKQPERVKSYERVWGKEAIQALLKADPDWLQQEGQRLFEQLAKEYADVPDPLTGTLGKRAALKLEALRQPPAVGQPALEIEGADIDGKKFKLSDYRGKVVLLVFTGDWCGACNLLHPQQRSLEKKLADKPFAQVNVNTDWILERRKKINEKESITWRAFQDSSQVELFQGPIATRWGIERWPTLFLIDHKGVIRQKWVGSPGSETLDREIDMLIREVEKDK